MRDDAPAVSYPVGRSRLLAGLLGTAWLTGLGAVVFAAFSGSKHTNQALTAIVLIASVSLAGIAAIAFWRQQGRRRLVWDGERWLILDGVGPSRGDEARVHVRLDLQRVMLLCHEDPAHRRRIWLWAEASHDPARWHLLRCALYSSVLSMPHGTREGEQVRA